MLQSVHCMRCDDRMSWRQRQGQPQMANIRRPAFSICRMPLQDDRTRQKPDDTAKAPEDVHMQSQALPASTPAPWPLGTDLRA